jgi:hypothetical protein
LWRGEYEYFFLIDLSTGEQEEIHKGKIMKISPDFQHTMTVNDKYFILNSTSLGDTIDPVTLIKQTDLENMTYLQYRGFTPHSKYCFFKT